MPAAVASLHELMVCSRVPAWSVLRCSDRPACRLSLPAAAAPRSASMSWERSRCCGSSNVSLRAASGSRDALHSRSQWQQSHLSCQRCSCNAASLSGAKASLHCRPACSAVCACACPACLQTATSCACTTGESARQQCKGSVGLDAARHQVAAGVFAARQLLQSTDQRSAAPAASGTRVMRHGRGTCWSQQSQPGPLLVGCGWVRCT